MAKSTKPSSKSAKSDRQAVIEQMRKKQRGAERRRGFAIVGVCIVVALIIVGAAAYKPVKDWWEGRKYDSKTLAEIGAPASVCQDITTKKATGNQEHVPTGTPVDYKDAPPAFGKHWNQQGVAPAPFARKFYDAEDRPDLAALVHNLEHGYTLLWYDETAAADDQMMETIHAVTDKFSGTEDLRHKFIAVPWTSEDVKRVGEFPDGEHIAFTHWSAGGAGETDASKQVGAFQYCSDVSGAALDAFVKEYPYFDSPEPNGM